MTRPVYKKSKDIAPGDFVLLSTCPYLNHLEWAKDEPGIVVSVRNEAPDCVVINYEGYGDVGYDPNAELQTLASTDAVLLSMKRPERQTMR